MIDDVGKLKCLDCENIFYMDTNVITYHLCCPYCKSDNLKELEIEDRRIYLVVRECGEIECAFRSNKLAEDYAKELEQMSENTTWSTIKTYCY